MSKTKTLPDLKAFLREVARLWPLAKGSLAEVRKPCIRANCPACRSGRKHKALIFTFTQKGKRCCRYVPKELEKSLRGALTNGRRLEQRLSALGVQLLQAHRRQRAGKGKAR